MSKHFRGADGSLLKADKRWSDLSNKQKEKIAVWMREAFQKHYPDDEAVLDEVFQKIDKCGIWIPDWEVIKRYNAKKPKYQKALESKKAEEENALKRYNITSCASKKYQSKNKMFDTSQRLQRIKQFVDKQRKIISQHFVDQSGTKSTKSFGENSFGLKLL